MSEFKNRIETQRETLKVVNSTGLFEEPLLSLAEKAIHRWIISNQIDSQEDFVALLKDISGCLFFLANKSQEQITEDYKVLSEKVNSLIGKLDNAMANKAINQTA